MCGIVGIFSAERPICPEVLERATRVLHHRGPDGQRQWVASSGRVGLGHTRLAIIDVETGQQPLQNEDARVHAVVNGELYDFERIRADLRERGHTFRTGSDSEVLVHLYEEYGVHCVQHLRGEFAFVLWDEQRQLLFAARDRFGIKPLFYADLGGTLLLASEAKALFAAGLVPRWDHETFGQLAALLGHTSDRSLFEGVCQLPPGHYMLATSRGRRLVRYWDFDYPPRAAGEARGATLEDVERLRICLDEAVRLRLRADVPVGCYLSGGLDSCTILGLMARHASRPVRAFNLSFREPEYDESAIAREMASHCNAELVTVPINQNDLAESLPDAIWHSEQIAINGHGVAKYRLSRAVREAGYEVVLTGEGADEIFAGYPHFRRDMLLYDRAGQDPAAVQAALADLNARNTVSQGLLLPSGEALPLGTFQRVLGFAPSWIESGASLGFKMRALLAPDFLAAQERNNPALGILETFDVGGQLRGRAPVHQSMYLWSKIVLPGYILSVLGDRMEMAHSVEGRVPFLDHEVVELARSLPVSAKIQGMTEKYVLREAAKSVLTRTVYQRQKHPFLAPPAAAVQDGALSELMQNTLRGRGLERVPFFERRRVVELLDTLPERSPAERVAYDAMLMQILSACILAERFGLS
jgi:asparagine synthase (glutamine-hydrolysing)